MTRQLWKSLLGKGEELRKSLPGRRRLSAPPGRRRTRPSLEALEDRLVPTAWTWVGTGTGTGASWSVSSNWKDPAGDSGVPSAGDQLQFGTIYSGPSYVGTDTPSTDDIPSLDASNILIGRQDGSYFASQITITKDLKVEGSIVQSGGLVINNTGVTTLETNTYTINNGSILRLAGISFIFTNLNLGDSGTASLVSMGAVDGTAGGTVSPGNVTIEHDSVGARNELDITPGTTIVGAVNNGDLVWVKGGKLTVTSYTDTMLSLTILTGGNIDPPVVITINGTLEVQGDEADGLMGGSLSSLDLYGTLEFTGDFGSTGEVLDIGGGDLKLESSATVSMRIIDDAGGDSDDIEVDLGTVTLGGTLNITAVGSLSAQPAEWGLIHSYNEMSGTMSGSFASINYPGLTHQLGGVGQHGESWLARLLLSW